MKVRDCFEKYMRYKSNEWHVSKEEHDQMVRDWNNCFPHNKVTELKSLGGRKLVVHGI